MSQGDPFFAVKREVQKTLGHASSQLHRWRKATEGCTALDQAERESARNELKTCLRNIELDLEDLDGTIGVVEQNPRRFHLTDMDVQERRQFVEKTRTTVKDMRDELVRPITNASTKDNGMRQALLGNNTNTGRESVSSILGLNKNKVRYERLGSDDNVNDDGDVRIKNTRYTDDNHHHYENDQFMEYELNQNQQMVIRTQDETLDKMGGSVHVLKNMSRQIGDELDEQSRMLDEFAQEMESTDSKLDSNMKKIAKVLHMADDKRQWTAIGVLALALFIIVVLLITL